MSRCPTCGAECGEPMIAVLRDRGFDPLEHCFFLAYYSGKIRECAGKDNRGQQTFVADGSISNEVYA